jgi:hypothetical protein
MNADSKPFVPRQRSAVLNPFSEMLTYQPLGQAPGQAAASHVHDAAWTPLWSDMFQLALQERERREFQDFEKAEELRWCFNQSICQQRNLIHVQPQRKIYCNVKRLEEQAAVTLHGKLLSL